MASLRDLQPVMKELGLWQLSKRVYQQSNEDNIFVLASALAYSWLFSIFPFLILLLSLVPYLPDKARNIADQKTTEWVSKALGKEAPTINDNLRSLLNEPRRGWLGISLAVSLWVASGGMSMTMSALDQCYDLKTFRPYYKQRPLAILLTLCVTVLVLLVFILLPIGAWVSYIFRQWHTIGIPLLLAFDLVRYLIAISLIFTILSIIYHFGPAIRQPFFLITPGGTFCLIVWLLLDLLFRFYIDRFARYDQTYGTVGGAAILLFFFYIIALVLLVGAEINSEIDYALLGVEPGTKDFRPAFRARKYRLLGKTIPIPATNPPENLPPNPPANPPPPPDGHA
jgi:membrane protein